MKLSGSGTVAMAGSETGWGSQRNAPSGLVRATVAGPSGRRPHRVLRHTTDAVAGVVPSASTATDRDRDAGEYVVYGVARSVTPASSTSGCGATATCHVVAWPSRRRGWPTLACTTGSVPGRRVLAHSATSSSGAPSTTASGRRKVTPSGDQQHTEPQGPDVGRRDAPPTHEAVWREVRVAHGRSKPVRADPATAADGVGTEVRTASTTLAAETSFIHSSGRTVTRWSRQACATALTSSGVT